MTQGPLVSQRKPAKKSPLRARNSSTAIGTAPTGRETYVLCHAARANKPEALSAGTTVELVRKA
jgi:hypothetical protein